MKLKIRILELVITGLCLMACPMRAAVYQAASCAESDVQAAVNKTVDGDTVVVPGCPHLAVYLNLVSAAWNSGTETVTITSSALSNPVVVNDVLYVYSNTSADGQFTVTQTGGSPGAWTFSYSLGSAPSTEPTSGTITVFGVSGQIPNLWTSYLGITHAINLIGAGIGNTIIIDGAGSTNPISVGFNGSLATDVSPFRVSGFTIDGVPGNNLNQGYVVVHGISHEFRIDHIRFDGMAADGVYFDDDSAAWGVVDHCFFRNIHSGTTAVLVKDGLWGSYALAGWQANHDYTVGNMIRDSNGNVEYVTAITGLGESGPGPSGPSWTVCGTEGGCGTTDNQVSWWDVTDYTGDLSWASPLNLGSNQAVYLEDDTQVDDFNMASSCTDGQGGARFVLRHSTCIWATNHGTESAGRERGGVYMEIYDNTFRSTSNDTTGSYGYLGTGACNWRSGTGVCFGNVGVGSAYSSSSASIADLSNYRDSANMIPWGPAPPAAWQANHNYAVNAYVLDSNQNIEVAQSVSGTGTSGGSAPTWPTARNATVTDNPGVNQIVWAEEGAQYRGACGGLGQFDSNTGTVYATGTALSSSTTDNLAVTSQSWTTNQWATGYSLYNVTENWSALIIANTATSITTESYDGYPNEPQHTWASGDTYQILLAYPCLDQIGRADGSVVWGGTSTTNPPDTGFPSEQLFPVYIWDNRMASVLDPACVSSGQHCATQSSTLQDLRVQVNRDYYSAGDLLNGAPGVQYGAFASRPSSCTPEAGYFATDTNTLYQCTATNTWTAYYTPYTYPHPLVEMDPCTATPDRPAASCAVGQGTATLGR